jgi:predicted CoA-binding protein
MKVALVGASAKPERISYQALQSLQEKGHTVYPIHPAIEEIQGVPVYPSVQALSKALGEPVDLVTLYVNSKNSTPIIQDILDLKPAKILFNPGAENPVLWEEAQKAGVAVEEACTLVLLRTGQL